MYYFILIDLKFHQILLYNKKALFVNFSENSLSEEIEFSPLPTDPNEMLSLTAFARKTAVE